MSFLTLAVIGNFLALLAILFERLVSPKLEKHAQDALALTGSKPDGETAEQKEAREREASKARVRIREKYQGLDERAKWIIAALIAASAAMLTGDAMTTDEKEGQFVTAQALNSRLSPILREQTDLGGKIKKLEDHVFQPPGGPGIGAALSLAQVSKDIRDINRQLASLDRRIETIHEELPTIRSRLSSLETKVNQLEKGTLQRPSTGQ